MVFCRSGCFSCMCWGACESILPPLSRSRPPIPLDACSHLPTLSLHLTSYSYSSSVSRPIPPCHGATRRGCWHWLV